MFFTRHRLLTACAVGTLGFLGLMETASPATPSRTIKCDVAMDGTSFFFEGGTNDAGAPLNGTPFVIQGYIYPEGTLAQNGLLSGVLPNGAPEFPGLVMGTWICRGWHLQDGNAQSGPVVATVQTFDFDLNEPGRETITTDGIELADFNVSFDRAITGGTGSYEGVEGSHRQIYVGNGLNVTGGFNTSFEFEIY